MNYCDICKTREHVMKFRRKDGIEDRNIGGLGIFLVTHLMDKMEYKREDEKNILTLTKLLSKTKE